MKHIFPLGIVCMMLAITGLIGCNDGSSGDPSTNDLGEFNPPGNLQTLTRDGKIVLTWVGANAEDDFQGYHVFGVEGNIDTILNEVSPSFPSGVSLTNGQTIPRCADNSAFFEKFGFPATESECETSSFNVDPDAAALTGEALVAAREPASIAPQLGNYLVQDEESTDEDDEEEDLTIDFNLPCGSDDDAGKMNAAGDDQNVSDGSLSLAASGGSTLGRVFCDVTKVWDATNKTYVDLANGTTYTFFVVAVKGSEKNEISWVSNLVDDTPAQLLFNQEVAIEAGKYAVFGIDADNVEVISEAASGDCATEAAPCKLSGTNSVATEGFYLGRDTQGTGYAQRVWASVSTTGGSLKMQARGPNIWTDPREESSSYQRPGDAATTTFQDAGSKIPVYGDDVFDIQATNADGDVNYLKVVINDISYETDNDKSSKSTLDVTIIYQPAAGVTDYLVQPAN